MKDKFVSDTRAEYETVRERRKNRSSQKKHIGYSASVDKALTLDWESYTPPAPSFTGTKVFDNYPLEELVPYIDWTPFFITWNLVGKYPKIFDDEKIGEAAKNLYNDAQAMLKDIIDNKKLSARGVIGFWPANRVSADEVAVYSDDNKSSELLRLNHLRQQAEKPDGSAHLISSRLHCPRKLGQNRLYWRFCSYHRALARTYSQPNMKRSMTTTTR